MTLTKHQREALRLKYSKRFASAGLTTEERQLTILLTCNFLPNVSRKATGQKKHLESDGLVIRKSKPVVPCM